MEDMTRQVVDCKREFEHRCSKLVEFRWIINIIYKNLHVHVKWGVLPRSLVKISYNYWNHSILSSFSKFSILPNHKVIGIMAPHTNYVLFVCPCRSERTLFWLTKFMYLIEVTSFSQTIWGSSPLFFTLLEVWSKVIET